MTPPDFKATIAVHTKYYAFRLAEGLNRAGVLDKLYTLYPKFKMGNYVIPHDKVENLVLLGGLKYFNDRLKRPLSDGSLTGLFDDWVAAILKKPSDKWFFDGYAGFCEKSLKKAKKLGGIALLERPCPHVDMQEELSLEEDMTLLKRATNIERTPMLERMKREYEIADYIMVPCLYTQKSFTDRGFDPSRVIIVPLCNEKDVRFRRDEDEYPAEFTLLCVGGNFYRLGVYYLLRAWKELGLQNAKLIIKGRVPDEFRDLTLTPGVEVITDHLSDAEMENLYYRASVFTSPAVDNGFGMAAVEAMRAGLPILITDNVGARDIIQDGKEGFVVPIRNITALAEKISFLHKNPQVVRSMGKYARETSKEYTPEKYAGRVVEAYKKILELH